MGDGDDFDEFFREAEPRLRRALAGLHGVEGAADAVAESLAWAWRNWERVRTMANPVGFLYRVGQSKARARKVPSLPTPEALSVPDVEPGLIPALLGLPARQRTAVWLVHGCHWQYAEVADAMGISASAVGTHVSRGLERLRAELGEVDGA